MSTSLNVRLVGLALLLTACGPARQSAALGNFPELDERERDGQRSFMRWCNSCHPQGDGGLGPALNDKPLPASVMRLQVRQGLGAMPAFAEARLSDADLDAILAYVDALQR